MDSRIAEIFASLKTAQPALLIVLKRGDVAGFSRIFYPRGKVDGDRRDVQKTGKLGRLRPNAAARPAEVRLCSAL